MPVTLHRLAEPDWLRTFRLQLLDRNARHREALATPVRRTPARFEGMLEASLQLAGIALVLDLGDDTVRADFADAAIAAHAWLSAGSAASAGPDAANVDAVIDRSGRATFSTTKVRRPPAPSGARDDWHIGVFSMVLDTLFAFGHRDAARDAAAAHEDWYRSAEVNAEEAWFADVRGKKCWVVQDDAGARAAGKAAVKTARDPLFRATSAALLSLLDGTAAAFHDALAESVKQHKRIYTPQPKRGNGAFDLRSLALCRMARTYGIDVGEQTYLPVRFLAPGSLRDD
jgi:hypothetical protein